MFVNLLFYALTGDHSSSTNEHEAKIDKRVQQLFEMEDPEIVLDLYKHNERVKIMSFGMSVESIFKKVLVLQ